MKICYLCGDFIKVDQDQERGTHCQRCELNYCEVCSARTDACYICGSRLVGDRVERAPRLDPESLFEKYMARDQRKHLRKPLKTVIRYSFVRNAEQEETIKIFKAVTKDISESGLCMYTTNALAPGQTVLFTECALFSDSTRAAVCWSRKVDEHVYTVGLKYAEHGYVPSMS